MLYFLVYHWRDDKGGAGYGEYNKVHYLSNFIYIHGYINALSMNDYTVGGKKKRARSSN